MNIKPIEFLKLNIPIENMSINRLETNHFQIRRSSKIKPEIPWKCDKRFVYLSSNELLSPLTPITMKVLDIKTLPVRVKLNQNFSLEEAFDVSTILQINSYIPDFDGCFKVSVTALAKDMDYNKSVSLRDWRNPRTGNYDLDIYEASPEKFDADGNFEGFIYVMETDDCFDLVDELKIPKYSVEDILLIVNEIAPHLKPHITETNVEQFIEGLKRKK